MTKKKTLTREQRLVAFYKERKKLIAEYLGNVFYDHVAEIIKKHGLTGDDVAPVVVINDHSIRTLTCGEPDWEENLSIIRMALDNLRAIPVIKQNDDSVRNLHECDTLLDAVVQAPMFRTDTIAEGSTND